MNGSGNGSCLPSRLTPRSSIDSSKAAWTLAGARLISSASRMLVNTGPWRTRKERDCRSYTDVPTMSAGMRSGVNCTRPYCTDSSRAMVLASKVLPTPGTPSRRTWLCAISARAKRRTEGAAAQGETGNDDDHRQRERRAPGGQHPGGRRRRVAGDLPVVKLIEQHGPAVGRERDQISGEPAVVGQSQVAIAKHKRIGHGNQLAGADRHANGKHIAGGVSKEGHL